MTDCICRGLPAPKSLIGASDDLKKAGKQEPRVSTASLEDVWIRLINLNAKLRSVEKEEVDADFVVAEATRTNRDLDAWRAGVKIGYTISITPMSGQNDHPFSNVKHVYASVWSAEVWNKWRVMKILSQGLILEHSPVDAWSSEDLERCYRVIRDLSVDICLSVPSSRK